MMWMRMLAMGVPLLFISCSSTRNITADPAGMTDFVVGQTYRLKQRVFLFGGVLQRVWDEHLTERRGIARRRDVDGNWTDGVLKPGTLLIVRKVEVERARAPQTRIWTEVYAEIVTGEQRAEPAPVEKGASPEMRKSKLMLVSEISSRTPSGYTRRDPEMLEAVVK